MEAGVQWCFGAGVQMCVGTACWGLLLIHICCDSCVMVGGGQVGPTLKVLCGWERAWNLAHG